MYPYTLLRSARRTLSLEVKADGAVLVRAPARLPFAEIERFLETRARWLEEKLALQKKRAAARPEPTPEEAAALLARAKRELPERVALWSARMGLTPAGVRITGAKTRYGSCSAAGRLCFSWRLLLYPEPAVEYVVVHELAHLKIRDHSRRFYALVERYLPDYRERLRLLSGC